MTPTPTDRERARELLLQTDGIGSPVDDCPEDIELIATALAQARKEGRAAGLEEAAAKCDKAATNGRLEAIHRHLTLDRLMLEAAAVAAEGIAAAIRALASAPPETTP